MLRGVLHLLAACVVSWHIAFSLLFLSRGDQITVGEYFHYVRHFLFGPGLEIPTFIQFLAVIFCGLYFLARGACALLRRRRAGAGT